MIKSLIAAVLALLATAATSSAATPVTTTQTNVLQNISLTLTIYQQGATNSSGTKVADKVTSYTTKNLIAALGTVTGQSFGTGAKLVLSTVYSSVAIPTGPGVFTTNLSTNIALATNGYLIVGGVNLYNMFINPGVLTISNNNFITGLPGTFSTNTLVVVSNGINISTNSFNTNVGYLTTITPSTNGSGVTNAAVLTVQQVTAPPTESVLTLVSNSIDILYPGVANSLVPVNSYLSTSTNSPEIVVETGLGLNTTNALTVTNLASQTGVSIQNLTIDYFNNSGPTNLSLSLTGFVKQALKVDNLSAPSVRGTNRAIVDILGASSTWNVIGSGYAGGGYTATTTNPAAIAVGNYVDGSLVTGFLTNTSPIVAEGSVTVSFLKNLAQ